MAARRSPTSTYNFGASRRESHDASAFYGRFTPPVISADEQINKSECLDELICGDASDMGALLDCSVALVVTSPPYFAGKEYEEALGRGDTPGTYLEYLGMLEAVFAECVRVLEPGGRIAVNVANLGRKPYRSLAADVTSILQDRLKLLLRGEIIWQKAKGSTGSCAWGTFQRPSNPVVRDMTERVIVASKGRFDRAISARDRHESGLPCNSSLSRDEFMEATTDLWEIQPESATRVGHPAPFPVALPERLIHLYTYYEDLVLDPFMGSGSTAMAAIRTGRHYVGYDTDPEYVALAEQRVIGERQRAASCGDTDDARFVIPAVAPDVGCDNDPVGARLVREGAGAKQVAKALISEAGFTEIETDVRIKSGISTTFRALDDRGNPWCFELCGGFTGVRPGLQRAEILWRALGKACLLDQIQPEVPFVLLTTGLPRPGSTGHQALFEVVGPESPVLAVIEILSSSGAEVLRQLAAPASRARAPVDAPKKMKKSGAKARSCA